MIMMLVLFIVFVLANLVLPLVVVLGLVLVIIAGFSAGAYAAWAAYKIGFVGGFRYSSFFPITYKLLL